MKNLLFSLMLMPAIGCQKESSAMKIIKDTIGVRFFTKYLFISIITLISNCVYAQLQNNQWRFGFNSAIDFNTTPPTFPSGTALPSILPPLITGTQIEGTASIADKHTGALLFYTDGVTVWNALNQPMPNGSNLGGSDMLSSYNAAVIIQMPCTDTKYYVFCIDDFEDGYDGITYSVVDMSLDNGLGDVVAGQKSIPLYDNESELLMAYPKSTGDGYWLISNGSDPFNPTLASFEVTSQGVNAVPILSPIVNNASGRLNYQGTKFVCTGRFDALIGNFLGFEIYDFNAATGRISSPVNIPFSIPDGNPFQSFEYTFNGNYLYARSAFSLYRFDLTLGNPATIAASATLMPFTDQTLHGTAQLGPDSNLYYVVGSKVFRIENPDNLIPGPISELPPILTPSFCLPQWIFLLPNNSCDTLDDCKVYIPNVFSPNNDGINDSFYPQTNCTFENYDFMIFDRWGNEILNTSNQLVTWDGKFRGLDCTNGVYIYVLSYKFTSQLMKIETGTITVLR